jgi:hypothetical protein
VIRCRGLLFQQPTALAELVDVGKWDEEHQEERKDLAEDEHHNFVLDVYKVQQVNQSARDHQDHEEDQTRERSAVACSCHKAFLAVKCLAFDKQAHIGTEPDRDETRLNEALGRESFVDRSLVVAF